jgi:hypothetical protein
MGMKIEFSFRVVLPDPEGGDVALGPLDTIFATLRKEVGRVTDTLAKYLA